MNDISINDEPIDRLHQKWRILSSKRMA